MPGTAEDALEEHGFDGDRLLRLARRIAMDELRRCGGFLDEGRLEDLVGFLALHGVRAATRYDPDRIHAKYGCDGGDPFASWIADLLCHRVTDWYRSKHEGNGDRRYHHDNRIVLDGEMTFSEPGDAFEQEIALRRIEDGTAMDEAEVEIAARANLSEQGRYGLHLLRLGAEGFQVTGKGTKTARLLAREELQASR